MKDRIIGIIKQTFFSRTQDFRFEKLLKAVLIEHIELYWVVPPIERNKDLFQFDKKFICFLRMQEVFFSDRLTYT